MENLPDYDFEYKGDSSIFAQRLRELMGEGKDKVTQKELADELGTTRQAISQYMDGSVVPNIKKLSEICQYFGVSADYLLGLSNKQIADVSERGICEELGISHKTYEELLTFGALDLSDVADELLSSGLVRLIDKLIKTVLLPFGHCIKIYENGEIGHCTINTNGIGFNDNETTNENREHKYVYSVKSIVQSFINTDIQEEINNICGKIIEKRKKNDPSFQEKLSKVEQDNIDGLNNVLLASEKTIQRYKEGVTDGDD